MLKIGSGWGSRCGQEWAADGRAAPGNQAAGRHAVSQREWVATSRACATAHVAGWSVACGTAGMRVTRHAAGCSGAVRFVGRWAGSREPGPSTPCRQAGGQGGKLSGERAQHRTIHSYGPSLVQPIRLLSPTYCMSSTKASSPANVAASGPGSSARGGTSGRSPSSTTQRRTCARGRGEVERASGSGAGTGPTRDHEGREVFGHPAACLHTNLTNLLPHNLP